MPPTAASQSLDLARVSIREIIRKAKAGSVEHLEALVPRILDAYEKHSTDILDALLTHIKRPSSTNPIILHSFAPSPGIIALQALCEVNRWYDRNPSKTPLAVSTSLRLFSASDDFIAWSQAYIREARFIKDEEHVLASYQITTHFFHSLISTPSRIIQTLSRNEAMFDLAILWWISTYDGHPIMYSDGMPPQRAASRDSGLAVFRDLVKENPDGMANAIIQGRVCTPAVFTRMVVARVRCFVRLNELKHLSERRPAAELHARENFLTLLDTTRRLRECSPAIRELLRRARVLAVFMEALGEIRQMPLNPSVPGDSNKARAGGMMEMLELVLDWVMCTPSDLIEGMRTVVEGGFLKYIGDCVRFAQEKGSRCAFVMKLIISYSAYPKVLVPLIAGVASYIDPKIHYLIDGSPQHSYFNSFRTNLEPLRKMMAVEHQTDLCDNVKHTKRSLAQHGSGKEHMCSACHTVAYCSKECQREDWDAFHRLECPQMRKAYLENRSERMHYPYRYRKYHTSLTRMFYESGEVVRRTITYTQNKWHEYDPCNVTQSIIIFPEDQDRAPGWGTDLETYLTRTVRDQNAIPSHLRPRFDAFVSIFRQSVTAARRKPHTPLRLRSGPGRFDIPNESPGSIRLAERAFRWGSQEKTVLLLMEQVKEVPIYTAPFPMLAEARALQSARESAWGQPIFRIFASLVYDCPKRSFASADVVPAGH